MSRSSPIYNRVQRTGYKTAVEFGARDQFSQTILVGTSATNSHPLARIEVTRRVDSLGHAIFDLAINGRIVIVGELNAKDFEITVDRTGEL